MAIERGDSPIGQRVWVSRPDIDKDCSGYGEIALVSEINPDRPFSVRLTPPITLWGAASSTETGEMLIKYLDVSAREIVSLSGDKLVGAPMDSYISPKVVSDEMNSGVY